jgi:hypothetical protein
MRLPSRASSTLAVLAVSAFVGGCEQVGEASSRRDIGLDFLAQQIPQDTLPRIRRPSRAEAEDLRLRLPPADEPPGRHSFYWTRAVYSSGGSDRGRGWGWGRRYNAWATDFPKGDRQFLVVLERLVRLDAYDFENAVDLADPKLRRYPMVYAVEVGHMDLTPEQVHGLRDYLSAGGLLVVDDFWGSYEWARFEFNIRKVLPGRQIVELPMDHPLFSTYYQIDSVLQVPNVRNGEAVTRGWGHTWEEDGYVPHVLGIFDDDGELMVIINWNTDLGDAWEWAEDPMYPLPLSTFAYEMGTNMIVYGMSH